LLVEAGHHGEVQHRLFSKGLVLPAGEHPEIGAGGTSGGLFVTSAGTRLHQTTSMVEVVTVDASGKAHSIVALITR